MVWTGFNSVFAIVSLSESTGSFNGTDGSAWPADTPADVVVATSTDNGVTFGGTNGDHPFVVSNSQSSAFDTTGGMVFDPAAAWEPGTNTVWVTWDNINVPFNGGGKRTWIRKLVFNSDGTLNTTATGPVTEVRIDCNLSCVKFDTQNIAATCEGAVNSDGTCGGTEVVFMGFPRVNNSQFGTTALADNQLALATQQSGCGGTLDVEWRGAVSADGGVTWTQGVGQSGGSAKMGEATAWPNCIVSGVEATPSGNNRGRIALTHDEGGGSWHAFWTAASDFPSLGGQRVWHTVLGDDFAGVGTASTNEVVAHDHTSCAQADCPTNQLMPAAASSTGFNPANIVTVSWLDTRRDLSGQNSQGTLWAAFSNQDGMLGTFDQSQGGGNLEIAQGGNGVPWSFSGTNADTPWGDHNAMATDNSGTFYPAWGDNRCAMTLPPTCPATETHVFIRGFKP